MSRNEEETRKELIDPALTERGWTEGHIRREESAGRIAILGGKPVRARNGRTDYTLRIRVTPESQPVAVAIVEAKAEEKHPGHGLEQSKVYSRSKALHVPFVFSTNGRLFVEFDHFTGLETEPKPLSEFPTPGELWQRYEAGMKFKLTDKEAKPLVTRYFGAGESQRRYYQDAAMRAVFEVMAKPEGKKRALLSIATGAGKTFLAAHLLRRLVDAGQLTRALFVCDRKELREQGAGTIRSVFGSNAAEVKEGDPAKNARVLIATYQTLGVDKDDGDASFLLQHYPENYFSHIIIDECHRSAWGKWTQVLSRNPDAFQIGLTATPRKIKVPKKGEDGGDIDLDLDRKLLADNYRHFGDPVYEYSLTQAMEDGYLAACEVKKRDIFLEDMKQAETETGLKKEQLAAKKLRDPKTGRPVSVEELERRYRAQSFERRLLLPDRVKALAEDLFEQLLTNGGPEQKTVIFCATDRHAGDLAREMNNCYARWCRKEGRERKEPYAFKCTEAGGGNASLAEFKGAATHHFVASTVDLITTGVDVPAIRNVVFARYLRSPIAFAQMVGRGTRIDPSSGKLMFRVWDYTNATRLFGEEFISAPAPDPGEGGEGPPISYVEASGLTVKITDGGNSIVAEVDGRAIPVSLADYKTRLASALLEEAPDLASFLEQWIEPSQRDELIKHLPEAGGAAERIRMVSKMEDFDLYDVLGNLAYGRPPLTRFVRAELFATRERDWLASLPEKTEAVLLALVHQFVENGIEGLELADIFDVPEVKRAGGLAALQAQGEPGELLVETKRRLFAA